MELFHLNRATMRQQVLFFFLSSFLHSSTAFSYTSKFGMVMSETVDNCAPPDEDAKAIDMSDYELISVSDTDVRINGSIKYLRDFANASLHLYTEKFIRGRWHKEIYEIRRASFCESIHNPNEVWYMKAKRLKGCPLGPGVRIFDQN
jgi:hypothetical protein